MSTDQDAQLKNLSVLTLLPEIHPTNLEDFFDKFNIYRNFAGWSDNQLCDIVKLKAGPQVKSVITSSEEWKAIKDIDVLKAKLEGHFMPPKSASDSLQEFSLLKQKLGEPIKDFAVRVESCASKSLQTKIEGKEVMSENFRKQLLLNQFINGINPNLKAMLVIQNPTTFAEAWQLAERIEKAQSGQTENIFMAQSQENNLSKLLLEQTAQYARTVESLQKSLDEMKIQLEKNNSDSRTHTDYNVRHGEQNQRNQNYNRSRGSGSRYRQDSVICFRCNRAGHIARECNVDFGRYTQDPRGRGFSRGNRTRNNLN